MITSAYWTPDDLARKLGVGVQLIRKMCKSGALRARKVGPKLWKIPERTVRESYPELFEDTASPAA